MKIPYKCQSLCMIEDVDSNNQTTYIRRFLQFSEILKVLQLELSSQIFKKKIGPSLILSRMELFGLLNIVFPSVTNLDCLKLKLR